MTLFDAEIMVLDASLGVPTPEALASGAVPSIELGLVTGIRLPIANPATGEPIPVAVGTFRYRFNKDQAIQIFTEGLEAAQALPDPKPASGLTVASNMAEVERAAEKIRKVTE